MVIDLQAAQVMGTGRSYFRTVDTSFYNCEVSELLDSCQTDSVIKNPLDWQALT